MLELETIVNDFETLVRLDQTENPEVPQLSNSLVDPTGDLTARLVYHPVLRNENLSAIAPNYDSYGYDAWVDGAYVAGQSVTMTGKYFTAQVDIVAGEAPGDSSKWLERGKLSSYLEERRKQAIRTSIMTAYNNKKAGHIARETMGDIMLYEGAGSMQDLIVKKAGRLVGFSIEILNNNGIEVIISKLSLQLNQAQSLNVYLWHQSAEDPIATINITQAKVNSVEWHDIPVADGTLKYRDLANDLDIGFYYIGYYEDDLTGQALNKRFTFGVTPCGTCSRYNTNAYKKYSQYVRITTFSVSNPPANQKMWDIRVMSYTPDTNWGMNLNLQNNCNLTQYLIDRRLVFADLIAEQLKYDLILEIANSTRANVLTESVMNHARGALQDTHLGGEGLKADLKRSYEAAGLEMSDLEQNVCMPKAPSRGVRSNNIRVM